MNASGLSTLEYAVLFVVILVGGLAVWKTLGSEMIGKVSGGHNKFSAVLSGERVSSRALDNTNRSDIHVASNRRPGQSSRSETDNQLAPRNNKSGNQTTASQSWENDVSDILFAHDQDKAFLQDLHNQGWTVTVYDRVYYNDLYYDGTRWTTRPADVGGTIDDKNKEIIIIRTGDPNTDAATIYHEAVHVAQPKNMELREAEYDAYEKEEYFRIRHNISPSDPTLREKINIQGIEIEDVNKAGIKAYVDGDDLTYPGITVASPTGGPPEQIVGRTSSGRTIIERDDGSRYTRAPKKGDSYPSTKPPLTEPKKGITINLGK